MFQERQTKGWNWSRWETRIYIHASAHTVFQHLTTAENLNRWLTSECQFKAADGHARAQSEPIRTGDRYTWTWHRGNQTAGHTLDVSADKRLRWTFGLSHGIPVNATFELSEQSGLTCVHFTQSEMASSEDAKIQNY